MIGVKSCDDELIKLVQAGIQVFKFMNLTVSIVFYGINGKM